MSVTLAAAAQLVFAGRRINSKGGNGGTTTSPHWSAAPPPPPLLPCIMKRGTWGAATPSVGTRPVAPCHVHLQSGARTWGWSQKLKVAGEKDSALRRTQSGRAGSRAPPPRGTWWRPEAGVCRGGVKEGMVEGKEGKEEIKKGRRRNKRLRP